MRTWPALLAAALLLSGCATVSAPEPGLTAAELADVHQRELDLTWSRTGLPDELRPPDPAVQSVHPDDWASYLADCLNAAGFEQYSDQGGSLAAYEVEQTAEEMDANDLAFYLCQASMNVEGSDDHWLNPAEVDYLYDYYQQMLLPCLALRDLQVVDIPSHQEFIDWFGFWNPYYALTESSQAALMGNADIFEECAPMPPGMSDGGIADAFGL